MNDRFRAPLLRPCMTIVGAQLRTPPAWRDAKRQRTARIATGVLSHSVQRQSTRGRFTGLRGYRSRSDAVLPVDRPRTGRCTGVRATKRNKMQHFAANRSRTKMLRSASNPQRVEVRDSVEGSVSMKLDSLFRRFSVDGGLDSRISARR